MSKPKSCLKGVPAIYRIDTIDKVLLGFVQGALQINPKLSVKKIINMFLEKYAIEDTFDYESALTVYYRAVHKLNRNNISL